MSKDPSTSPRRPPSPDSVRAREAGLALKRRVSRWMIAGAVILTGGVSAVTAQAFYARSPAVTSSSAPAAGSNASSTRSGQGSALQAPSQAPSAAGPAPAAPVVVSGGS